MLVVGANNMSAQCVQMREHQHNVMTCLLYTKVWVLAMMWNGLALTFVVRDENFLTCSIITRVRGAFDSAGKKSAPGALHNSPETLYAYGHQASWCG